MDKYDLLIDCEKIINSYEELPKTKIIYDSLEEELCNLIGDNVDHPEDIKFVIEKLNLESWEHI